jgi:cobalt-zinc-cadmium efflux system protein
MPHDHGPHGHAGHDHAGYDHHAHGHSHAPARFGAAFAIGTVLNTGIVLAEIIGGLAAGSVALLADAAHNAGDVLSLLLAWGAVLLAQRLPSVRRTYGWGRGSILAALINAIIVLIGVGAIMLEAARRFSELAPVATGIVIWVALAGIAVNGATAWLFSRGHADLNIRATFVHMLADVAISAGVVIAALLVRLTGLAWIDPAVSLLIAVAIVVGTWGLLRDALNLAMDGVPAGIMTHQVEDYLRTLPDVVEVHDLHIWALSTTETALTAHLVRAAGVADERVPGEQLVLLATRGLAEHFRIGHATLQVETQALAETCRLRPAHVV